MSIDHLLIEFTFKTLLFYNAMSWSHLYKIPISNLQHLQTLQAENSGDYTSAVLFDVGTGFLLSVRIEEGY